MKTKLEQFGQKFIYVILIIWLSTEVLFDSNIEKLFIWEKNDANDFMAVFVLVLLVLQIIVFQKYNFEEMVVIGSITAFIALATINSNHKTMMSTWIFIVAAKHLNIDKAIKVSYFVQLMMVIAVIYMFYIGMIDETVMYRGSILRHSLGFTHPNQLGIRLFQMMICHCYIRRNKINIIDLGLILGVAWFIKKVADSKTSYYALIILFVLVLVEEAIKRFDRGYTLFAKTMVAIYVVANIASIILSVVNISGIPFLRSMDKMMSTRFSQCHRTYKYYGISLFGKDIQVLVKRHIIGWFYHFWLDNAYMAILLRYGIIVFLIFSILYLMTMMYLFQTRQYTLLAILALYAVYGIMENNFFSMSQNYFLLLMASPIYYRKAEYLLFKKRRLRLTW